MIYPQWVSIAAENVSKENPVTSRFAGLDLLWTSSVELTNAEGINAEKLISSSDQAYSIKENITANPMKLTVLHQMKILKEDQLISDLY